MTILRDLVSIRTDAALRDAVQLELYDHEDNDRLAREFIFGDFHEKGTELSTSDILKKVRDSFLSTSAKNVHVVISGFGTGKSHFGLALANYFGRPAGHPALDGVLASLRHSLGDAKAKPFESFRQDHAGKPFLTVLMTGSFRNLRQSFLQALHKALDSNDASRDFAIKGSTKAAADWCRNLSNEQKLQADAYLKNPPEDSDLQRFLESVPGIEDLGTLQDLLDQFNPVAADLAVPLSKALHGLPLDFGANVSLSDTIFDVIAQKCGEGKPFRGLLIVLDELGEYLRGWLHNPVAAGSLALQELTDACSLNVGKMAFMTLIQVDPTQLFGHKRAIGSGDAAEDQVVRFTKRLEPKYNLVSSLERVIRNYMAKGRQDWLPFSQHHTGAFARESHRTIKLFRDDVIYRTPAWTRDSAGNDPFHDYITLGCFPLHPATVATLCHLNMAQGRTILQFVRSAIEQRLDQPAETVDGPAFVFPEAVVKYFLDDMAADTDIGRVRRIKQFKYALADLGHGREDEARILRALLLHYFVGIFKPGQPVAELAVLSGLPEARAKELLDTLRGEGKIRFDETRREYEFFDAGRNPAALQEELEEELESLQNQGRLTPLDHLLEIGRQNQEAGMIAELFATFTEQAKTFKFSHQVPAAESSPWCYEQQFKMFNHLTVDNLAAVEPDWDVCRGLTWLMLPETEERLAMTRERAEKFLASPKAIDRARCVILGVPDRPVAELAQALHQFQTLSGWKPERRKTYGPAYDEALKSLKSAIRARLSAYKESLTYYFVDPKGVVQTSRRLDAAINDCLTANFSKVPPLARIDKLKSHGTTANKHIEFFGKALLGRGITDATKTEEIRGVAGGLRGPLGLGLLQGLDSKLTPTEQCSTPAVAEAWTLLEDYFKVGKTSVVKPLWQRLQAPPFGYEPNPFSLLLCHWLGRHRSEVSLRGKRPSAKKNGPIEALTLQDVEAALTGGGAKFVAWAEDLQIQRREKPKFDDWVKELEVLTRVADARQALADVGARLESAPPPGEHDEAYDRLVALISGLRKRIEAIESFEQRLNALEATSGSLELLLSAWKSTPELAEPELFPGDANQDRRPAVQTVLRGKIAVTVKERCQLAFTTLNQIQPKILELQSLTAQLEPHGAAFDLELKVLAAAVGEAHDAMRQMQASRHDAAILQRARDIGHRHGIETAKSLAEKQGALETCIAQLKATSGPDRAEMEELLAEARRDLAELEGLPDRLAARLAEARGEREDLAALQDEISKAEVRFEAGTAMERLCALKGDVVAALAALALKDEETKRLLEEQFKRQRAEEYLSTLDALRQRAVNSAADGLRIVQEAVSLKAPDLDSKGTERQDAIVGALREQASARLCDFIEGGLPSELKDLDDVQRRLQSLEAQARDLGLTEPSEVEFNARRQAISDRRDTIQAELAALKAWRDVHLKYNGATKLKECEAGLTVIRAFEGEFGSRMSSGEPAELAARLEARIDDLRALLFAKAWATEASENEGACERVIGEIQRKADAFEGSSLEATFKERLAAHQAVQRRFREWRSRWDGVDRKLPSPISEAILTGRESELKELRAAVEEALEQGGEPVPVRTYLQDKVLGELAQKELALRQERQKFLAEWFEPFEPERLEPALKSAEQRRKLRKRLESRPRDLGPYVATVDEALHQLDRADAEDRIGVIATYFKELTPDDRRRCFERLRALAEASEQMPV